MFATPPGRTLPPAATPCPRRVRHPQYAAAAPLEWLAARRSTAWTGSAGWETGVPQGFSGVEGLGTACPGKAGGGDEPGVPDGMKVDVAGNVYCGGAGGLWIMDTCGKKLGRIVHGAAATTNLAFVGEDWKTLYCTSRNHLGAVHVKIPGISVPPLKK